ncbi:LolA family protein [Rhodothermus bifroesti]|uniref:Outer membrane lipoprotein carrier protein LolA n=1 Tax=Rhodothermus marinus TaxID=29549 RepID=A0A7V2AYM0_RHOMR|nr:outer membrane lipoprotein carrier protein LolA [Rhodothermus bifroesti]GBD02391.1 Outer-membrane lipoprotein carrier protein [bacterium HR18]
MFRYNSFRYRHNRGLWVLFGLVLLYTLPLQAQSPARQVMERLRERYAQLKALQASFIQITQTPYANGGDTLKGTLLLSGDRYRIETPRQLLVTDGQTTWVYLPETRQVVMNRYVVDETAFSLHEFLVRYPERYNVEGGETVRYQGERHYRLRLRPRQRDAAVQEVTLWVRDRDLAITRLEVRDVNETHLTFMLTDIRFNPVVPNDAFTFHPPSGVEIVDLRE